MAGKAADRAHWEQIYKNKGAGGVSWYRPHLERSLRFIRDAQLASGARLIDVGGGASTLVDDLLAEGFVDLTVVDIAAAAIDAAKARLGASAERVQWIVGDITRASLPARSFDFWHDRAVFHFLTDPDERRRYVDQVRAAVKPGGHVVVATFGPAGPERCSGLEVVRYSADGLHSELGGAFQKVSSETEQHTTPWGTEQQFVYCYCRVLP